MRRIRKHFVDNTKSMKGFGLYDFYQGEYRQPMAYVSPTDDDNLNKLLTICNTFGIAVGFWDGPKNVDLPILDRMLNKPFILVDLSKLDSIVPFYKTRQELVIEE